jgi:cation transport regulator
MLSFRKQEFIMYYRSNHDLPDNIEKNLPEHAQTVYRVAFNRAWNEYKNPSKRRKEETAHRVAWAAVKEQYEKQDDRWVAKEEEHVIT